MPGLMRGMARTAAVVGTATATRNAVDRRQASKNAAAQAEAQAAAAPPPQYVEQAPPAAPAAPSEDDQLAQLERLGNLKAQGILSEEEFAAQKAKILGM
jgi:hypothetical protein